MSIMMTLSIVMSMTFIFMKHPMSMGMILLMQTTLISLITGFNLINFWFSYILFLIMIGGMLILFIYMTSVASNEKFKYSNKIFIMMILMLITLIPIIIQDNLFYNMMNLNMESFSNNNMINFILNKYINFPFNIILMMLIIYLFITLIAVVKISNIYSGPLRQKN
uniref:NADH-ubiquinone oxidoreductase chain 6 n=1 Tax=Staphylinidae sp. BMNH 1274636 TaxID=1796579 RepID=A0A126TE72_9COLE|nr:NADH dehydrogenase subunit 6 [Staphylinidae sp. BMNH 1274636]